MLTRSRAEEIERRAAELAREHGTSDPELLAERMGIMLDYAEHPSLLGFCGIMLDVPFIALNSRTDDNTLRCACAHELGHYLLHSAIAKEQALKEFEIFNMKNKVEYDANIFAAHLLIDEEEAIALMRNGCDVFRTAMELRVNPNLLNIKLSELNSMGHRFDTDWGDSRLF